ncbi:response regulator [Alloacidobacterium dinghuense]|uniref:Response regulator n=1 Tax=Alloacidobacterium dinghuense TaxID=2763107 RepID=A0A7G8BFV4_9BACT|nr:response regulator [Alloacidobacterium dinghuense]QNI31424.1 response regulator [Alloacidobacterium dinghuense]
MPGLLSPSTRSVGIDEATRPVSVAAAVYFFPRERIDFNSCNGLIAGKPVAQTLAWIFTAWGYDATAEYSGEAALMTSAKSQPDLAVIDMFLTDINGVECANQVRRRYPECRIILLHTIADPH